MSELDQRTVASWRRSRKPFGYSDRHALAVPIFRLPDGAPYWKKTAADMRAMIATLIDPADPVLSGRFKRKNRDALEQIRQGM